MPRILILAVLCLSLWAPALVAQDQRAVAQMRVAMTEMRAGDWEGALAAARRAGPVGVDIIEWHRLRARQGSFDEVRAFLARNGDWPGLPLLRSRAEGSLPLGRRAEDVLAFFADNPPQSGAGSIALAAAYRALGRGGDAEAQLVLAWVSQPLSTGDEALMLEQHGELLRAHHTARLDWLVWRNDEAAARRLMPRVPPGWRALAEARLALRAGAPGVDRLIEAIPAELQDDPGLAFERFLWRAQKGRYEDAIAIALTRRGTIQGLGEPEQWASWRRALSRWAMRQGDGATAYALATQHGLVEGSSHADLEWLSGYIALRYLEDPELALVHFQRLRVAVEGPISLGRAGYWEGRAHEAMGRDEDALAAYAFGAEHQTSFYGLLSAERAGLPFDLALTGGEDFAPFASADFADTSVMQAAVLLYAAGETALSRRFAVHLAETLDPVELGQLADYALSLDEPNMALMIAKQAASRGVILPRAYFPTPDLGAAHPLVRPSLALAIARRESEFDPAARSGVGARGLMQVMPGTAREVAGKLSLPYDEGRLVTDPVYNAQLGVGYLAELVETFGPNMILISAAYNAGPSRPLRWIEEQGDPRYGGVDPVDWIEHIQFRETRNYVMRVLEGVMVYEARLRGAAPDFQLSDVLAAR